MHSNLHSGPLRLSLLASALWAACATQAFAQGLPANALPTGWNVTSGSATFAQSGNTLTIHQTSQQAIANFSSFNVGSGALVDLRQLNSSAALLARVNGGDPSQIHGGIRADGALWLINQAGIMVGPGARIDVARFIASSLNVSDSDFLAGRMNFKGTGTPGEVRNAGTINAASGGSIYLVGANVANTGSLNAPQGEVLLAAGQTVQLVDTATPGVSVAITGTPGEARNLGQITAEAGRIGLVAGLVSNSGTISASSAVREGGRIFLRASGDVRTSATSNISANGTTGGNVVLIAENAASLDGQVSATGSAGRGGYVDTSGHRWLDVVNAPTISAGGEWHIDPFNIEIVAAGPNAGITGENAITSTAAGAHVSASMITNALDNGLNVSITTGTGDPVNDLTRGDITVSSAIAKTAGGDATLTLNANNNIIVNAPITSTSNKLNLNLNSNYQNNYPADNHAVQFNANLALNGGALTITPTPVLPPPIPTSMPASAPTLDICKIAPNSALCQVLTAATPVVVAVQPATTAATTALDSSYNLLPMRVVFISADASTPEQVAAMPVSIPASGSSATQEDKDKQASDKKDDKSAEVKTTVAKNEPAKKTYCN